jgi:NAD(P)-dependent dehydrogenase (short-subunit alcohol dehydrogenase family)
MVQKEITMHNKPVALVTGANQGIGLQIAKVQAATQRLNEHISGRNQA